MNPTPLHPYKPLRSSAPPRSILNPAFRYTDAAHTNLQETFARVQQAAQPKTLDPETEVRR